MAKKEGEKREREGRGEERRGGSKWLKGKGERRGGVRGDAAATVRLKP